MHSSDHGMPHVVSAGRYAGDAEQSHLIDVSEILLVRSGQFRLTLGRERIEAASGSIVVIPGQTPHHRSGRVGTAWVTFEAAQQREVPRAVTVVQAGLASRPARWVEDLCDLAGWPLTPPWRIANPLLAALLEQLRGGATPAAEDSGSALVRFATGYMQEHRASALTVARVARAAGVSARYLTQLFQREVGVSPLQFLLRLRMAEATERLRTTSVGIKVIAYDLGYKDLGYFVRQFRKFHGCTPGTWRKRISASTPAPPTAPPSRSPS